MREATDVDADADTDANAHSTNSVDATIATPAAAATAAKWWRRPTPATTAKLSTAPAAK